MSRAFSFCGVRMDPGQAASQIFLQPGVLTVDITALLPSGQKDLVRIADDSVRQLRIGPLFQAPQALVAFCPPGRVGDHMAALIAQVGSDDDADIIKLQSLGGVDTAYLLEGISVNGPGAGGAEVPAGAEAVLQFDIIDRGSPDFLLSHG